MDPLNTTTQTMHKGRYIFPQEVEVVAEENIFLGYKTDFAPQNFHQND